MDKSLCSLEVSYRFALLYFGLDSKRQVVGAVTDGASMKKLLKSMEIDKLAAKSVVAEPVAAEQLRLKICSQLVQLPCPWFSFLLPSLQSTERSR